MKKLKVLVLWMLAFVMLFVCACTKEPVSPENPSEEKPTPEQPTPDNPTPDQPIDYYDLTVRSASGANGVVSAGSPYATKAGLDVLQAGGNAFDAAVAAGFALGLAEPYASGLGGGGQMIGYNAKTNQVVFYNFPSIAPKNAYPGYQIDGVTILADYSTDMKQGVTSCGIPMETAGLLSILEDLGSGKVTRQQVLAPAIDLATNGFPLNKTTQTSISSAYDSFKTRSLEAGDGYASQIYGNGLRALRVGETFKNPDYAKVLQEIADKGKAGFYQGWVAEAIVEAMDSQRGATGKPGLITMEDLEYAMNEYVINCTESFPALETTYQIYGTNDVFNVYSASLGGGGMVLMETLNMIEYYCQQNGVSLGDMGHNSSEYIHLLAQSMHMSFGDKRKYAGDARHIDVPLEALSSKEYAAARFDSMFKIDDTYRATSTSDYGGYNGTPGPWDYQTTQSTMMLSGEEDREYPGTTSLSVADKEGNVVCITKTINTYWGSFVMPKGTGFFLNNGLTNFSISDTSNNQVGPYKQTAGYMAPMIVMKDGMPYMAVGSPGSEKIPMAQMQVFLNVAEFGMTMQEAIEASRIFNYFVSIHDFEEFEGVDPLMYKTHKLLHIEAPNIQATTIAELEAKNYYIHAYDEINQKLGGVQAILFNYDANGNVSGFSGGADPRRGGKALGF